ncbi:MAG TPA: hypothetical protein VFX70_21425 [Mycobacteriales bacterium]|nr:hypothetical protein [Mycobacteriales bacterium]
MNEDVRSAGEALLEQGRAAVGDARKPLLAVVGAGDLAVTGLRAQFRDLPAGTQAQVRRLSDRAGELAERVRELDPASVRANVGVYLAQARTVYESLAERGGQVIARRAPRAEPEPAQLAGPPRDSDPDTASDPAPDGPPDPAADRTPDD